MGAAALGIRNLLLLRGDDPTQGDQQDAKPVFDLDSRALTEMARAMRDDGALPHGQKVAGAPRFFLGAADAPIDPPPDWQPTTLAGKIESGAQFAQTQFCMDTGVVRRYVARLADAGLIDKIFAADRRQSAALGEVGALDEAAPVRHHHPGRDDRAARGGERSGGRRAPALRRADRGAGRRRRASPGVHVMAPGNDAAVPEVMAEARQAIAARSGRKPA